MKILTIAVLIAKEMPTSKDEIFLMAEKNETFKLVSLLTKHIKIAAIRGNENVVKKGLELMGTIYEKGNLTFQSAVENIFVFSCDQFLVHNKAFLLTALPKSLQKAYLSQVYHSGL